MTPEEATAVLAQAERLYDQPQIEMALDRMAAHISSDMRRANPITLCVMNGGLIIAGHLFTRLNFPMQIDYLHVTRYRCELTGGQLIWNRKPVLSLEGRVVLVIDDILDEGHTLAAILTYCRAQAAERVAAAVLVNKRHARKHPEAHADYLGLYVDDRYVFGFGMDYRGYLRNLPEIYAAANR